MLLQCAAISLDSPAEWKADTQYLTQITSEFQNILTSIFCWCRVHAQLLVFTIKNTSIVLKKKRRREKTREKNPTKIQQPAELHGLLLSSSVLLQRPDTTIDDIKEFLASLVEFVSTFISALLFVLLPLSHAPSYMACFVSLRRRGQKGFSLKECCCQP